MQNTDSSGESLSVTQIFNCSKFRRKIKDGTLGLLPPEALVEGEPDLHCFLLDDDTFALISWLAKRYSKKQLTREERIANCRISRDRRVVENVFEILVSRIRVLRGTMEQRPKVVRDMVLICVVLYNIMRTRQGEADWAPTPAGEIAALQMNRWCMCPMTITGTF